MLPLGSESTERELLVGLLNSKQFLTKDIAIKNRIDNWDGSFNTKRLWVLLSKKCNEILQREICHSLVTVKIPICCNFGGLNWTVDPENAALLVGPQKIQRKVNENILSCKHSQDGTLRWYFKHQSLGPVFCISKEWKIDIQGTARRILSKGNQRAVTNSGPFNTALELWKSFCETSRDGSRRGGPSKPPWKRRRSHQANPESAQWHISRPFHTRLEFLWKSLRSVSKIIRGFQLFPPLFRIQEKIISPCSFFSSWHFPLPFQNNLKRCFPPKNRSQDAIFIFRLLLEALRFDF